MSIAGEDDVRPYRVWQNYAVAVLGGLPVVIVGLISNFFTDNQCVTETENTAGEHCDFLHAHPAWFLVPAALVTTLFAFILLRRSTRPAQYIVVALSFGIYAVVLVAPMAWVITAGHGGG